MQHVVRIQKITHVESIQKDVLKLVSLSETHYPYCLVLVQPKKTS